LLRSPPLQCFMVFPSFFRSKTTAITPPFFGRMITSHRDDSPFSPLKVGIPPSLLSSFFFGDDCPGGPLLLIAQEEKTHRGGHLSYSEEPPHPRQRLPEKRFSRLGTFPFSCPTPGTGTSSWPRVLHGIVPYERKLFLLPPSLRRSRPFPREEDPPTKPLPVGRRRRSPSLPFPPIPKRGRSACIFPPSPDQRLGLTAFLSLQIGEKSQFPTFSSYEDVEIPAFLLSSSVLQVVS